MQQYSLDYSTGQAYRCGRFASKYPSVVLNADVGLCAFEISQVRPADLKETEGGRYRAQVRSGKDTGGGGGKPRDAFLPVRVERDLQQFQNSENIAPRDPFVDMTGDDFVHVNSHDLRRQYAQRLLVDETFSGREISNPLLNVPVKLRL
jgi:hypothetical protein